MTETTEDTPIYQEVLDILGSMEAEAEQRMKRLKMARIEKDNFLQMISEHCDDIQCWLEAHFEGTLTEEAEGNPKDPEEEVKKLPKGDPFPSAKDTLYDA